MSNTMASPASLLPPAPPPNALDTNPGANPTEPVVQYQLSSGHVASLPQSSVPALLQQDKGAKQIPSPAQGEVLVQLSSGHTATLPSTSLPALKQQDPNYKYIAGDAPAEFKQVTPNFDALAAVAGPTTAFGARGSKYENSEVSGVSDVLHGNVAQGARKIYDAEKPHVIQGSPLEKALQKIDPSFQGSVTPEENSAVLAARPIVQPAVDAAQFIDKNQHPADKALVETAQSLTSPANLAILYSTGGLGLVDNPKTLAYASRLISGGFSATAIANAYQHYKGFREAVDKGDYAEADYQITSAISSGVLGLLAAKDPVESAVKSDAVSSVANKLARNPFRNPAPDLTSSAVRTGVENSTVTHGTADQSMSTNIQNNPILKGNQTVLAEPLDALMAKEKAAYDVIDKTAGFDLKEAKLQLRNDEWAVKQPGVSPEQQLTIQDRIANNTAQINKAEAKLSAAGIDPKSGDAVHTARMAGQDFQNVLVRATDADGNINLDKLLNQSKALRFAKRGDRLAQFMGKDGADEFMNQLQDAQKAGASSLKKQQIAKAVGTAVLKSIPYLGAAALGGATIYRAINQ